MIQCANRKPIGWRMNKQNTSENHHSKYPANNSDLVFVELAGVIWRCKWNVAGTTFITLIFSAIYAFSLPNLYRAEVLLALASEHGSLASSSFDAGNAGLESTAGANFGSLGGSVDKATLGLEILQSRDFIGEFIVKHDIAVTLMTAKGWNDETALLKTHSTAYSFENKEWIGQYSPEGPSSNKTYQIFSELLDVRRDPSSSLVRVSLDYYSPYLAHDWLTLIVEDINLKIRSQNMIEATNSIGYLEQKLEEASLAELRTVLYELIQDREKDIMLINAKSDFFRVIDPGVAPNTSYAPKKKLILLLGLLLGILISLFFIVVRNFCVRK